MPLLERRLLSGGAQGWTSELTLARPLAGTLTISGDWTGDSVEVSGILSETGPIPSALRDALAALAQQDGTDWTLSARFTAPFASR